MPRGRFLENADAGEQPQHAVERILIRAGRTRKIGNPPRAVGQVIGLIEAMKLFNEIKSDLAGRVVRVVPESGALVKAKQPLIEVEPL